MIGEATGCSVDQRTAAPLYLGSYHETLICGEEGRRDGGSLHRTDVGGLRHKGLWICNHMGGHTTHHLTEDGISNPAVESLHLNLDAGMQEG